MIVEHATEPVISQPAPIEPMAYAPSPPPRVGVMAVALIVLAMGAYLNAVKHPFLYDDIPLVLKNPGIRSIADIPEMVGMSEKGFELRTRWTRQVTHALEYAAVGPSAPAYHATNIALHALIVLLAFTLFAGISGSALLGWWTAALFAVHPINTEVVAHVSGRRDLLAAFFSIAGLVLLQRYTTHGGRWRPVTALVAFYLAASSKEVALLAPVAFVLVDLYAGLREAGTQRKSPSLLAQVGEHLSQRKALYAVLAIFTVVLGWALLFLTKSSPGMAGSPSYYETSGAGIGLLERARIGGLALRLLLLPLGQTIDYSYDALNLSAGPWAALGLLDICLLLAGAGLMLWGLVRRNWAGLAGAWMVLFYLPHLGIIPWHEIFAERFLYLSGLGFCLAAAAGGLAVARSTRSERWAGIAGLAILALLGAGTILRNQVWGSGQELWQSAVSRYPNAARAHKALADVFLADAQPIKALEHYQEAAKILPSYRDAHVGVAVAHAAQLDLQRALAALDVILERWPNDPKAWNLKGYIHQTMGESSEAMIAYKRAVEVDPGFAEGYNNMAKLYLEDGDMSMALRMYRTALKYDPSLLPALRNMALVYREGMRDPVQADYYDARADQLANARR